MIRNISIGIDIGSSTIKVVVAEFLKGEKYPKIIGVGESETEGMRHGYVTEENALVLSIKKSIAQAEKTSNIKIRRAYVSINTVTLKGDTEIGVAIVSKADGEVTMLDINKALEECEEKLNHINRKILQTIPVAYKLDGKEIFGSPLGYKGTKLEIKGLVINCSTIHIENLIEALAEAGIDPINIIPSTLAGGILALSQKQKIVGCALVNIGAETVSVSIFENNDIASLQTFSIGSNNITNDIALGLRIPLEEAEQIKIGNTHEYYSKKKIDEIIHARMSDIFELIENHFKKMKRSELLPAGIIFIGGGANIANISDLSKNFLMLPSRVGSTDIFNNTKTKLRDPSWITVLGLVNYSKNIEKYAEGSLPNIINNIKQSLRTFTKQLMP
ncbi:MAG: cell division protein FtsA [bacterium]|nr:cell division protein FtsA [bacterium]